MELKERDMFRWTTYCTMELVHGYNPCASLRFCESTALTVMIAC